ncbi:MAG: hypothetical protein ACFCGT_13415 [Sandaracinaceae bacterium]
MDSEPDVLASARPRRLRLGPGGWELDVERLLPVAGALYRPCPSTLRGREVILRQLGRSGGSPGLAAGAKALMDGEGPAAGQEYVAVGDRWEPGRAAPTDEREAEARRVLLDDRLLVLEASVSALQRTCASLRRTVAHLEGRVGRGAWPAEPAERSGARPESASAPGRRRSEPVQATSPVAPPPSSAPAPNGEPAPSSQASSGPPPSAPAAVSGPPPSGPAAASGPPPSGPAEVSGPPPSGPPPSGPAAASGPPPSGPAAVSADLGGLGAEALALPDVAAYAKGMSELLGVSLELRRAEGALDPLDGTYLSSLVDASGDAVGAIVMDLMAVVQQGGDLVMLGTDDRQAMLAAGVPTEDAIEAASEVVTAQAELFGAIEANPPLHAQPVRAVDAARDGWLRSPRDGVHLVDRYGSRVSLFAR